MLTARTCLQANKTEVAAKVMDGEAILINITSGMYHSTDKAGGLTWELIEQGHSLEQIAEAVVARYDVPPQQAQADVERLAQQLLDEKLVCESDGPAPPLDLDASGEKLPYESPTLNTYRDMADLLALDPPMPGLQQTPWEEPEH